MAAVRDQLFRAEVQLAVEKRRLQYLRSVKVELTVDRGEPGTAAERVEGFEGRVVRKEADVSDEMTARLLGPKEVEIVTDGPARRQVTEYGDTTWTWLVTAKQPEKVHLTAELFAHVRDARGERLVGPRVFAETFQVRVGPMQQAQLFIKEFDAVWIWLTGAAATLGGAVVWVRKNFGRKTSAA